MPKRKQLTLFLDERESSNIEAVRKKFNLRQYELIASHITLCKEYELGNLVQMLETLARIRSSAFQVPLGSPKRFYEGKGVFIPVIDPEKRLEGLRATLGLSSETYEPHITIMHPRNSTCTEVIFEGILQTAFPKTITIRTISLIEQEVGKRWHTLESFPLS